MKIEMSIQEAQEILKGLLPECLPVEMREHLKEDAQKTLGISTGEMSEEVFAIRWSALNEKFGYELREGAVLCGTTLWDDYKSILPFEQAKKEFASFRARLIDSNGVKSGRRGTRIVIIGVGKTEAEKEAQNEPAVRLGSNKDDDADVWSDPAWAPNSPAEQKIAGGAE